MRYFCLIQKKNLRKESKKCNSLFELYQDYVAWDISDMMDIEQDYNDGYDEDDDTYYGEHENESMDRLENKEDIKNVSDDWGVVAYAGFEDDNDIDSDDAPCVLINTKKNTLVVNDLFDFDSEFYMMGNLASGTLYGRKGVKVIVDTDKMSYFTNDVYSNVFLPIVI